MGLYDKIWLHYGTQHKLYSMLLGSQLCDWIRWDFMMRFNYKCVKNIGLSLAKLGSEWALQWAELELFIYFYFSCSLMNHFLASGIITNTAGVERISYVSKTTQRLIFSCMTQSWVLNACLLISSLEKWFIVILISEFSSLYSHKDIAYPYVLLAKFTVCNCLAK